MNKEFAIMVLKPDGLIKKNFKKRIEDAIVNQNLKIIATQKKKMSEDELSECFTSPCLKEEYSNYMTSGPVIAYLINGYNAMHKIRLLKFEIRKFYGLEKQMKNLIHHSDSGTEYYKQFNLFFKNYDIKNFCGIADIFKPYSLTYVKEKHEVFRHLSYCGVILNEPINFEVEKNEFLGLKKKFVLDNINYNLIFFFKYKDKDFIYDCLKNGFETSKKLYNICNKLKEKSVIIINTENVRNYYNSSLTPLLKNIHGIDIYRPNIDLSLVEELEDFFEKQYNIYSVGGSWSSDKIGITLSFYEFYRLFSRILA